MSADIDYLDKRQDRLEVAIAQLTTISADLNKMIAVHEQRIIQNEKDKVTLTDLLEKRRQEIDLKFASVYDTMRDEDSAVLEEISKLRQENKAQHEAMYKKYDDINTKLSSMEKVQWVYMGGITVIVFIITNLPKIISLFI